MPPRLDPDPYGVPGAMFGPLDPELPALIGRVVMMSALLESKLEALASALGSEPQERYAGKPVSVTVAFVLRRLELYNETERETSFVEVTRDLLTEVDSLIDLRNSLVHCVWPDAGVSGWNGWRPTHQKRQRGPELADWESFTRDGLIALIGDLVEKIQGVSRQIAAAGGFSRRP